MLLVLATRGVLTRPWCLIEIATSSRIGVPTMLVEVKGQGFEISAAHELIDSLEETLDADAIDTLHEPEPHARIPVHSVHTVQQLQQLSCSCTVCAAGTSTSVPTSPS